VQSIIRWFGAFFQSKWGIVFKVLGSLLFLVCFFYILDLEKIKTAFATINYFYLLPIVVVIFLRIFVMAWRFYLLVGIRQHIRLIPIIKQYMVAAMFNMVFPSVIGGDGIRVFLLAEEKLPKREGLLFILLERILGLLCLLILSGFFSFFLSEIATYLRVGILIGAFFSLIGIYVFFFAPIQVSFQKIPIIKKLDPLLQLLRSQKIKMLQVLVFSFVFQIFSVLLSYLSALAFGIHLSFIPFLVFVPLVWIVLMLPLSIGGIGIREAAFVYFFAQVGLSSENAFIISVGTYLAFWLNAIFGAMIFFYDRVFKKVSLKQIKE